jgi:hypothetical protein
MCETSKISRSQADGVEVRNEFCHVQFMDLTQHSAPGHKTLRMTA